MRTLVTCLLAGVVLSLPGNPAAAQATLASRGLDRALFPRLVPLVDGVYAWEAVRDGDGVTTNSLIVITPDGVVVVDPQGTPENARRLLSAVARLTAQPVRTVVIGTPAREHVGGLGAFPAGVQVIATDVADEVLRREPIPGPDGTPVRAGEVLTLAVDDVRVITRGGVRLEVRRLGRARTGGGDLVVALPEQGVLYLSDTYLHGLFPWPPGGYPTEWIEAVRTAEGMPARWVVPGHGFVDDEATLRRDLTRFRLAMERARAEGSRLYRAGVPIEQAAAMADFGEFADWPMRAEMATGYLRRVYEALNGTLKVTVGEEFK